jgi:hypothetical protein
MIPGHQTRLIGGMQRASKRHCGGYTYAFPIDQKGLWDVFDGPIGYEPQ